MAEAADHLRAGHAALARGAWAEARAAFEAAGALEESAEALEGLGMAAWWLDDASTVFEARARAFRLYRARGDGRGAGRVAMALAEDHLYFRGETAVARGWHGRAHRLLEGLGAIPERGWLVLWEGDFACSVEGDAARAARLAAEAGEIGRALGLLDLEMAALGLEGFALVAQGQLRDGMSRLDEATTAAVSGEMTDPIAIGFCCCYLIGACERVRDFDRAAQWCERVRAFSERWHLSSLFGICRTQYAGVLVWRGEWADAERELEAAIRHLAAVRPALQAEGVVRLAGLRRRQGRFDEAGALLKEIDELPVALLERAALALDRDDPRSASHLAARFLRQIPAANRADRLGALEVLLRARLALGEPAEEALAEIRATAEGLATDPVRASARLCEGLVALAAGAHDDAHRALADAVDLFGRSGARHEAARARIELGRCLAALGHRAAAASELRGAAEALRAFGAAADAARAEALLSPGEPLPDGLTRRETEVLKLLAQGLSNQQIARQLFVSEFTVKRHVANILTKLSLPTRAAAAAYAARAGMV